jgi:hypothetical protein
MEVKIGVRHAPRELIVDVTDSVEEVEAALADALGSESGVLSLTDSRGRRVLVPAHGIAYLEVGSGVAGTVGFRG